MEFLKALFNGKALTFEELVQAVNAHNGDEANKENQIKVGNLGGGEYVSRGKYDSEVERLKEMLTGKDSDLQNVTATLESLKKGKVDAEAISSKLATAEKLLEEAKAREAETLVKYALRDALREAKATDIDYMTYKVNEKLKGEGKTVELDENEHIKGWDDLLSGLKTQFPTQFAKSNGGWKVDPNPLQQGEDRKTEPQNLADALRQQYENKSN